jgi:hypothetical protein
MKAFFIQLVAIFGCFFISGNLFAQDDIPKISIQGTLKDANGAAVDDGTYAVTFSLYNSVSGGTAGWTEVVSDLSVSGGVYSYVLGSDPGNPLDRTIFAAAVYLGVKVGSTELTPRTELTYAPYALSVNTAQNAIKILSTTETCTGSLGDIKYSILSPAQFQQENGDCWVPMDGREILGTRLAEDYGWNNVPNMSGAFIRSAEFSVADQYDPDRASGAPIGELQLEATKAHTHTFSGTTATDGAHQHSWRGWHNSSDGGSGEESRSRNEIPSDPQEAMTRTDGAHSHSFSGTTASVGGNETRPVNRNFYAYIRVDD